MRIAYLDCFSGISGDMFLGALVDAGVSAQILEETVASLKIGARLEISRVNRSGISATKVDVVTTEGEKHAHPPAPEPSHSHEHGHTHTPAMTMTMTIDTSTHIVIRMGMKVNLIITMSTTTQSRGMRHPRHTGIAG